VRNEIKGQRELAFLRWVEAWRSNDPLGWREP